MPNDETLNCEMHRLMQLFTSGSESKSSSLATVFAKAGYCYSTQRLFYLSERSDIENLAITSFY